MEATTAILLSLWSRENCVQLHGLSPVGEHFNSVL